MGLVLVAAGQLPIAFPARARVRPLGMEKRIKRAIKLRERSKDTHFPRTDRPSIPGPIPLVSPPAHVVRTEENVLRNRLVSFEELRNPGSHTALRWIVMDPLRYR